MIIGELTPAELEALHYLADAFHKGNMEIAWDAIPSIKSLDKQEKHKTRTRLVHQYKLVENRTTATVRISEHGLNHLHDIDNPPPKDYWANLVRWFRGRWWSLPFILVVVGLPLLIKWIEMLKSILRWLEVIK